MKEARYFYKQEKDKTKTNKKDKEIRLIIF